MKDKKPLGILTALGLGVGAMYLFDPSGGVRRRAIVRDKILRYVRSGLRATDIIARDLAHRTQGVFAKSAHLVRPSEPDDDVLLARVRTRLGRLVMRPHAVEVHVLGGHVLLAGHVYGDELHRLIRAVARMSGVHGIVNELKGQRRESARERAGQPLDIFQKSWSPATRFLVSLGAGFIALYGMRRQDVRGVALSSLAILAGLRAISNRETRELISAGPLRGGYRPMRPEAKPRVEPKTTPEPHEIQVAKTRELEPAPAPKPKAA